MESNLKKVIKNLERNVILNEKIPEDLRTGKILDIYPKNVKKGKIVFSEEKDRVLENILKCFYKGKNPVLRKDLKEINFDLSWTTLNGVDFSGLDLRKARFNVSDLSGAIFSGARLDHADFSLSDISGGDFSNASASIANFSLIIGSNANFSGANLSMANMRASMLTNADFTNANLSMSDLSDCNLAHSNFNGAMIEGISIENSIITGTIFELVIPNEEREKKRYGTDHLSSTYRLEKHDYKGEESVYAIKSHYVKKGRYS